ncbi:MAG: sensor domain-containing diguanylate cyclase [Bacillota bacterium]
MENSSDFYKRILDNIYDGVYFVDRKRVITYWNKGAERITGYTSAEVIGKCCSENILMHVNERGQNLCTGFCPLTKAIADGSPHEEELYLLHKSGYRVPIVVKIMPLLDEKGQIAGAVEVFSDNTQHKAMAEKMKKLAKMAFSDDVTDLTNRRYAEMKLSSMLEAIKKEYSDFGILMIEIYYSDSNSLGKVSNDVLKIVSRTLAANIQPTDIASRWDDNRFLMVFEHARKSHLLLMADKLRTLVVQSNYMNDTSMNKISISIGGACAKVGDSLNSLVQRAVQHVLEARNTTDNSVKVE